MENLQSPIATHYERHPLKHPGPRIRQIGESEGLSGTSWRNIILVVLVLVILGLGTAIVATNQDIF